MVRHVRRAAPAEGYQTLSKGTRVWAPWWQFPPFDFFAELVPLPLQDKHYAHYKLRGAGEARRPGAGRRPGDPDARAGSSSRYHAAPATGLKTRSTRRPSRSGSRT